MSGVEPACWSWPVPAVETVKQIEARIIRENARLPVDEQRDPRAARYVAGGGRERFNRFHAGRCAVCGSCLELVTDHCHGTGQVRGRLCVSCNALEGKSNDPLFEAYRRRHPAAILNYYQPYHDGLWWIHGWSVVEHMGSAWTRGLRPATPWPRVEAAELGQS